MERLVFFTVLVYVAGAASGEKRDYFTAAVFEANHVHDRSSVDKDDAVGANMNLFARAAEVAAKQGADIIVFPEYGLFPHTEDRSISRKFAEHVPDPQYVKANPCKEKGHFADRTILLTASCMAQSHNMYVVINLGDIQKCDYDQQTCDANNVEGCTAEKPSNDDEDACVFNTDVVFDREGNIIARYHKNHLYKEFMDTPPKPELVSFNTEYGVFGIITCFDIVFKEAAELVKTHNVDTLVLVTHWYDDILPLKAPELQQGWSLGNKVNLLAANGHYPQIGQMGSGIYSKDYGALAYTYNPDGMPKLVVARVPLHGAAPDGETSMFAITPTEVHRIEKEDGDAFPVHYYDKMVGPPREGEPDYRCYKPKFVNYALKKLEGTEGHIVSCHEGFCCSATYSAQTMDEDYYLAVFNGTSIARDYFKWEEEACFVVRCDPFEGKPCVGVPTKANTVFDFVKLKATFSADHIYPGASTVNERLIPKAEWQFERQGKQAVIKYVNSSQQPLVKIGFFGRCYDRDPPFVPFYKF